MKIAETFETIKAKYGVTEKSEIARVTGLDLRRVGDYLSGKREQTSEDYAKIAAAAGISAGELWEAVQKERATDERSKSAWENYMKRLGGIAASVLVTVCITVTMLVTSTPAKASPALGFEAGTFCIMLSAILASQLKPILRRIGQKCPFRVNIARFAQMAT